MNKPINQLINKQLSRPNTSSILITCLTAVLLQACQHTPPAPTPRQTPTLILGDSMIVHLHANRFVCQSSYPMQCMNATDETGKNYTLTYNAIDGFIPNPQSYRLKIRPLIDSQTGNATGRYVLDEILSR